jgi:integrase
MAVTLPNVKRIKGKVYFCKKIQGRQKYEPLPEPTDPKFAAAYMRAQKKFANLVAGADVAAGTFSALLAEYRRSSDYQQNLSQRTRDNYEAYLVMIEEKMGKAPVKDLKTSRVEKMRDELQATPGKANNWLKVLRAVLSIGVRRDYVMVNVADAVGMLELGEHQPWPQEVIDRMLSAAPSPITKLAIQTGLYSGQRISDCIRITHRMMESDTVHLYQHKKRSKGDRVVEVFIPVHPAWRQAVAAVPRRADTILYDRSGRPFKDPEALQERIRDLMKALGCVDASGQALYTFHGLRKNSSNYLKEMGLNDAEIGAINGMSADTVRHYTKGVQKRILAEGSRGRITSADPAKRGKSLTPATVRSGA